MSHVAENLAKLEQREVEEALNGATDALNGATDALNGATRVTTLLDLVAAVADASSSEEEVIATVKSLINSGKVTLVGEFLGADVKVV